MGSNKVVIKLIVGGFPLRPLDTMLRFFYNICSRALMGARGYCALYKAVIFTKSNSLKLFRTFSNYAAFCL